MKLIDERLNCMNNVHFGLLLGRIIVDESHNTNYVIEDMNVKMAEFFSAQPNELIDHYGLTVFHSLHQNMPNLLDQLIDISKGGPIFDFDWYQSSTGRWMRFTITSPLKGYFLTCGREITKEISSLNACKTQLALDQKHQARYESLIKLMGRHYTSHEAMLKDALQEAIALSESFSGCIYSLVDGQEFFVLENCKEEQMRAFLALDSQNKVVTKSGLPLKSICIPIVEENVTVATLCVANKKDAYDQFDIDQLTLLMNTIWGITKEINAQETLSYISFHDQLTGLYNRYYFEIELERLDNSRHLPMTIIIGDVNGLKLTNDVFGHLEGDRLLKALSATIKDVCRDDDIIARWGGDEFILLLPETPEEGAEKLCRRIEDAIQSLSELVISPSISLGYSVKYTPEESLIVHLKIAEDRMYKVKLTESINQRNRIINAMQTSLYEKNHLTETRVHLLSNYATAIGEKLGLNEEHLDELRLFANLHDIGKIAIPDQLLAKPDSLNFDEWNVMKKHPEIGYRIAQSTPELSKISEHILYHHERFDGLGYPKGLSGNNIPIASRIISVLAAFDAMTSYRPYSSPISKESALREIRACGGSQFDPDVVEVFLNLMEE